MKRLIAFTVIELMVTLVISSIVIIVVYYSYFLISNQFNSYRRRAMEIENYYWLSTAWRMDFERAQSIRDTIDNKHFIFTHLDTVVNYVFDPQAIIRETSGVRDTFPLAVNDEDIVYMSDSLRLIREATLSIRVNGDSVLLSASKFYSSKELISAEIHQHD